LTRTGRKFQTKKQLEERSLRREVVEKRKENREGCNAERSYSLKVKRITNGQKKNRKSKFKKKVERVQEKNAEKE
jgi:hypothetical protein